MLLWQWGVGCKWEPACVRVDHVCVCFCVILIRLVQPRLCVCVFLCFCRRFGVLACSYLFLYICVITNHWKTCLSWFCIHTSITVSQMGASLPWMTDSKLSLLFAKSRAVSRLLMERPTPSLRYYIYILCLFFVNYILIRNAKGGWWALTLTKHPDYHLWLGLNKNLPLV